MPFWSNGLYVCVVKPSTYSVEVTPSNQPHSLGIMFEESMRRDLRTEVRDGVVHVWVTPDDDGTALCLSCFFFVSWIAVVGNRCG